VIKNVVFVVVVCLGMLNSDAQTKKATDYTWACVRWTWTGDVYDRQVICVEWQKKDCSRRLHPEICKLEGRKESP
jgi:hypothetical protein